MNWLPVTDTAADAIPALDGPLAGAPASMVRSSPVRCTDISQPPELATRPVLQASSRPPGQKNGGPCGAAKFREETSKKADSAAKGRIAATHKVGAQSFVCKRFFAAQQKIFWTTQLPVGSYPAYPSLGARNVDTPCHSYGGALSFGGARKRLGCSRFSDWRRCNGLFSDAMMPGHDAGHRRDMPIGRHSAGPRAAA